MMIYILTSGSIGAWKCWLAGWSVILKRQGRTFSEDYDRPTNPPTIGHEDPNNSLRVTLSTRAPSDNHFNLTNLKGLNVAPPNIPCFIWRLS